MRLRRTALGLGGLLLAAQVLVACGGPDEAGGSDVVPGTADAVDGATRSLVVPTGTLEVTVGAPVDELAEEETRDLRALTAPDGSSFVPVHWRFDSSRAPLDGRLAADPQELEVRAVVGEESRSLGTPYDVRGPAIADRPARTFYVVLPGEPATDEVSFEVDYDGATLVLAGDGSTSGLGAQLEGLADAGPATVACPTGGWRTGGGADVAVVCDDLRVFRTPYWPTAGWAADDGAWRVLEVPRLGAGRMTVGSATYSVDSVSGSVAGAELTGGRFPDSVDGTVVLPDEQLTAEDGTASVALEVVVEGSLERGDGPATARATLRRELRLPAQDG